VRWDRDYSSSDVDDRRGEAPPSGGGGGGGEGVFGILRFASMFGWPGVVIGLVIAGVVVLGQNFTGGGAHEHRPAATSPKQEELKHFVSFVFDDVQKSWAQQMPDYKKARLEIFSGAIKSACGTASSAVGPFYCPLDQRVYIDLTFYDELRVRFGASGDFAQAYVIAHEVGHHVQNLRGVIGHGPGRDSIHVELQADCLAGAWARDADRRGEVEAGDVDSALNAASKIGDDAIQKRTQGHVRPETFTHGTSAQRQQAFRTGLQGGASACGIR
jgi:predicted metalloprotease